MATKTLWGFRFQQIIGVFHLAIIQSLFLLLIASRSPANYHPITIRLPADYHPITILLPAEQLVIGWNKLRADYHPITS